MRALEELRTQVRSSKSRRYIDEAIASYSAAAYRASIISIWIAVVSDLIDKIRMMADEADAAAISLRKTLDAAIKSNDKVQMQKFENALLESARDQLQLIGHSEYVDLQRLKDDRNLCAHPAYITDEDLFSPTPERVRAHLSSAVDSLLMHGPVNGRKLLDRFEREIDGQSFPSDDQRLKEYLKASYLDRSTVSLRLNLCKVVCKSTLDIGNSLDLRWNYTRAASALSELTPVQFSEGLHQVLDRRQDQLDEVGLMLLISGLCYIDQTWDTLNKGVQGRIEEYLKNVSIKDMVGEYGLYGPAPVGPVGDMVLSRIDEIVHFEVLYDNFLYQIRQEPDRRVLLKLIEQAGSAISYRAAEAALRGIIALVPILNLQDLQNVLAASAKNDQIYGSVLGNRQLAVLKTQTLALLDKSEAEWAKYEAQPKGVQGASPGSA